MSRASNTRQRNALKLATRAAVEACGGGVAIDESGATRVGRAALSRYAASQEVDNFPPLDVALDLDLASGQPFLARALASAQGFDLKPRAGAAAELAAEGPVLADVVAMMMAGNRLEADLCGALADGRISAAEQRTLLPLFDALRTQLNALQAKVSGAEPGKATPC